ncbi:hypothetical protein ACC685_38555, partial [Rhizobium ruizarguesonis]
VAYCNPDQNKRSFEDRASMTRVVQSLRGDHNSAPDTAIRDVAMAVRKHVDAAAFNREMKVLMAARTPLRRRARSSAPC